MYHRLTKKGEIFSVDNRTCKLKSMDAVNSYEAAEKGEKAIKKYEKKEIRRKRRQEEKKSLRQEEKLADDYTHS